MKLSKFNFKKNFLKWLILGLVVAFFILALFVCKKQQSLLSPQPIVDISLQNDKEEQNLAQTDQFVEIPQPNTLYLFRRQKQNALFITNSLLNIYYENGVKKTSQYIGNLRLDNGRGYSSFNYNEIDNPKRILTLNLERDEYLLDIQNFVFNKQKDILFVAVNITTSLTSSLDVRQEVYQINLNSLDSRQIWDYNIADGKYPKDGPIAIDEVVDDKYVIFSIFVCYGCGIFEPHGSVILNIETKKEEYLGEVGNFQFDLVNILFTYQNLVPFEEDCGEDTPNCWKGKRDIYRPAGTVHTSIFP